MPSTASAIAAQVRGVSGSCSHQNANSPARIGVIAWITSTCATVVWLSATMKLAEATAIPPATSSPAALATERNATRSLTPSPKRTNASTARKANIARPTIWSAAPAATWRWRMPPVDHASAAPSA